MSDTSASTITTASQVITYCAALLPVILTTIRVNGGMPPFVWSLGLASWGLMVLTVVILRCVSYVVQRIDHLTEAVNKAMRTQDREVRAAAIVAALDNVTSINAGRR